MKAEIITIGDEILIGQIVDTNAAYIAQRLNSAGFVVSERSSVGDRAEQIVRAIEQSMQRSDVVITTGGLGPTKDDITKTTLATLFGGGMHVDRRVEEHVRTMLAARNIEFNELNRSQAMVPDSCEVLFNAHGTAPGMWFERDGKVVISLPGVPFEMRHLMEDEVLPRLKSRFALRQIVHRTMITSGIAESMLAARIAEWEDALPEHLHLAYLPSPNIVRLRLSAYEVDGEAVAQEIEERFRILEELIADHVVGYEGATVQEQVHRLLVESGKTLAVAESCTGGSIAAKFTAMAGASAYFLCGVTAYANEAKRDILGVDASLIEQYGAVSEQVARAMAEGVRHISGADYAVATTGIAGPAGGTAEKPVGTVWFAVSSERGTVAMMRNSGTDRGQIIDRATAYAIELLRDHIKSRN
ncbi:MAG: competence/damage-inducible protein A [Alistipes sp.]|nr:competence/damage-inducible protein A [Alistipes sp.]MBQ7343111.1 competence/damage-inducible protein A [Alistipes sp.]